jgi:hypothetical protein
VWVSPPAQIEPLNELTYKLVGGRNMSIVAQTACWTLPKPSSMPLTPTNAHRTILEVKYR